MVNRFDCTSLPTCMLCDRSVIDGKRLTLHDVTIDDSGEYTCEAVRRLQQADASLTITVHGILQSLNVAIIVS